MNKRQQILDELKEISLAVANLSENNFFSVPANYFDNLANEISSKIRMNALFSTIKTNPYNTPKGYFTQFEQKIMDQLISQTPKNISVENELKEIAPLLNAIDKKSIYTIPQGYFDVEKVLPTKPSEAKVIKGFFRKKITMYAAAAIITAFAGLGVVRFMQNSHSVDVNKEITKRTDDELSNFLEETTYAETNTTNTTNESENDLNLFENTSTEEIKEYLQKADLVEINQEHS